MEKNKSALQTIILTVLVTIMGFIGLSNPIVMIAYPIIITLIGLKHGVGKGVTSFITSLVVIGVVAQNPIVLIVPLQYGILSIATVYMVNKKYKTNKIFLYGSLLVFTMVLIHMGLKWYFTGINTFTELENTLTIMTTEQLKTLDSENMSEGDISLFVNLVKSTKDYIVTITPVLLMISSAVIAYINYYISTRLTKLSGRGDIEVPEFSKIVMPTHVIKGLGTLLVLSYSLKYLGNFNYQQLLDNIFVLMFIVFLIEGLSLTVYLIDKMKIGKVFKTFFIVIVALSSFLNIVLFSIGIMDIILDFRKLRKKPDLV